MQCTLCVQKGFSDGVGWGPECVEVLEKEMQPEKRASESKMLVM